MDVTTALLGPASIELDADSVREQVKYFYGVGGYEPESFVTSLLEAISHADAENRERLRLVFPAYVAAMETTS